MIELIDCDDKHRWLLYDWRTSPAVAPYMYTGGDISRETHEAWYDRLLSRDDRRGWVIKMDGSPVGAAFMSDIDRDNRRASWAFYLAEESTRGRGVGSAVEFLVLEHAFGKEHLHKLCCEVLSFNEAVVAMHKKFGFVEEGLLRQHWWRDDRWVDTHVMAMFASDWSERREEFERKLRQRRLVA